MYSTVFGPNNTSQLMVFPNDYEIIILWKKLKNMKIILIERGLWRQNLLANCKLYKKKVINNNRIDCCIKRIISLQSDFFKQESFLKEIVKEAKHQIIIYLKFYYKLNYIKRYWKKAKGYIKQYYDYF